jgi:hypothetical protein
VNKVGPSEINSTFLFKFSKGIYSLSKWNCNKDSKKKKLVVGFGYFTKSLEKMEYIYV